MGVLKEIFTTILNMSVTASIAVLLVLGVRFLIRKAPKSVAYLLWAVVGFRLICPYSLPSAMSVFNLELIQKHAVTDEKVVWDFTDSEYGTTVSDSPQSVAEPSGSREVSEAERKTGTAPAAAQPAEIRENITGDTNWKVPEVKGVLTLVWLAGMGCFAVYELIAYYRLKRRVSQAVRSAEDVYECDAIDVPFVIGIVRPHIYLPFRVGEEEREYILLHERYHIKRRDYLVKAGALLLLMLHWFNPLVWAAYHFMCVDMEMSCDEKVIQRLGGSMKCSYSRSLLSFAMPRRMMPESHLAFGESSVKTRIKNVLSFEKPGKAVVAAAAAFCIFAALFITGNAQQKNVLRHDGKESAAPGAGIELSYSVGREMKSFLLYREIYEGGELSDYKLVSSGVFEGDNGGTKRRGKIRVSRVFKNENRLKRGRLYWEINGTKKADTVELWQYGGQSVTENYLVGDEVKRKEFKPEEDFVVAAWHLGDVEHKSQNIPCSAYDQTTRNKALLNANPGEVLYRMVVSELEEKELKEKYRISPQVRALYEARNPYIGDASANGRLLELLNVGSLGEYTMELQTSEEPYVLTVNFKNQPKGHFALNGHMKQKATMLLALIENAGEVHWTYPVAEEQGETKYRWKMDCAEAEARLGIDGIKECAETAEALEKLFNSSLEFRREYEEIARNGDEYVAPNGKRYQYEKYLYGMLPNAEFASSYVVLTNEENLTFDDVAWSMLSSSMTDELDFYWVQEQYWKE